jgi:3-oxoacyl-[acyl-carrier protein] reductase
MPLTGKIAVVTGSSKGIGFAIAKEFAENNDAIVIVCSRNLKQAQIAADKIKGNVFADELDVTDDMSVNKLIEYYMITTGLTF